MIALLRGHDGSGNTLDIAIDPNLMPTVQINPGTGNGQIVISGDIGKVEFNPRVRPNSIPGKREAASQPVQGINVPRLADMSVLGKPPRWRLPSLQEKVRAG